MTYDEVPDPLQSREQWLLWDAAADKPRQPHWNKNFGISWSDPDDWHEFDEAVELAASVGTWGLGYVTAVGNDDHATGVISVIDIDGAVDENDEFKDWVPPIDPFLDDGRYAEWSPSHDEPGDSGVHIPVVGTDIPEWFTDVQFTDEGHEGVDLLANKFCTVTGDRIDGAGDELARWADDWVHEWLAQAYENVAGETPRQAATLEDTTPGTGSGGATVGVDASETGTQAGESAEYEEWADEAEVRDALAEITPDVGYPNWRDIGFALVDHFDSRATAREVFTEWSRGDIGDWDPAKWDRDAPDLLGNIIDDADSSAGENGVTIATVIDLAQEFGWTPDTGDTTTDAPADPEPAENTDASGADSSDTHDRLLPADVKAVAGVDSDTDIADLDDRVKAACVWELVKRTDEFHVRVRRDTGTLWAYDSGVWEPDGERALRHAARRALGPTNHGANVLTELKEQVRSDPAAEIENDTLGLEPGFVAVENGRLDLDVPAEGAGDDAIRPLQPEDYALARLPVEYDPEATCPEWREFVGEVVETEKIEAVQEYVGYCLHRNAMPFSKALLLVGSGSNGKSTFLNVVRALLGEEHTTSKPVHKLEEDNHVADLYGSLANIDADLSDGSLSMTGIATFKRALGGDQVDARRLYEDAFSFKPTAKHLYACNQVPDVGTYVTDQDIAFWRRWIIVQFPNYFPPSVRDEELQDRLTTDTALSAVLNWAIDGRRRLLDQGGFTNVEDHDETRRRWQSWGDTLDEFVAECVEPDEDAERITTGDAFRRYMKWCRENGKQSNISQQRFTNTVKQKGVGYGKHRIDGKVQRGYTDLGLSDEVPELDDDDSDGDIDDDQSRLG